MNSISSATSHAISHQVPPGGGPKAPPPAPAASAKPAAAKSDSALDIDA